MFTMSSLVPEHVLKQVQTFSLSSLVPEHVLKQIPGLPGYSDGHEYERLANGQHDEDSPQRATKYNYKIYASILCALLVTFLAFKGAVNTHISISTMPNTSSPTVAIPKYMPEEQINTTESQLQQINATKSDLDQIVDIPKETKALVVSARSRDVIHWMEDVQEDWIQYPYLVTEDTKPNSTLSVPANNGNEAMRYFSFIIDNYDSLPDIIAFRHGHNTTWHQRFDSAAEVNHLNLTTVHLRGYQNFNCELRVLGCDQHIYLADKQRAENATNDESNGRLSTRSDPPVDEAIYQNWDAWFGVPMPEDVTSACCAQFAVSKEAVYRRTKEKYMEYRQWLLSTNLESRHSGMVFERLWHVVFGMAPVVCGSDEQCYCDVYTTPLSGTCPP